MLFLFNNKGGTFGTVIGWVFTIIAIIIMVSVVYMGHFSENAPKKETQITNFETWKDKTDRTMAYIMMEDYVKDRLASPRTAIFPGVFEGRRDHVRYIGNQQYRIASWVDSENYFGALIRMRFYGVVEQTDKDYWRLISLEFEQQ